jgi:hypothetical protein
MKDLEPNDERLHRVLHEWKVEATLPPRFQDGVWRRIERQEVQAPAWLLLLRRAGMLIARPSGAASYLAVLLFLGIVAGYWQARVSNAQAEQMLSARYVQLVDPYQNPHP